MIAITNGYSPSAVYRMILRAAVPIPLTVRQEALMVDDLQALAQTMPHDDPASVFLTLHPHKLARTAVSWQAYVDALVRLDDRRQALARVKTDYPALRQE